VTQTRVEVVQDHLGLVRRHLSRSLTKYYYTQHVVHMKVILPSTKYSGVSIIREVWATQSKTVLKSNPRITETACYLSIA
jgi:hypothetical protein